VFGGLEGCAERTGRAKRASRLGKARNAARSREVRMCRRPGDSSIVSFESESEGSTPCAGWESNHEQKRRNAAYGFEWAFGFRGAGTSQRMMGPKRSNSYARSRARVDDGKPVTNRIRGGMAEAAVTVVAGGWSWGGRETDDGGRDPRASGPPAAHRCLAVFVPFSCPFLIFPPQQSLSLADQSQG
jgi:hypothetical protein